ncbi:MAG TPA: family 1 glycosylhydrolase [Oscillatoriaceae cyanobacterium]
MLTRPRVLGVGTLCVLLASLQLYTSINAKYSRPLGDLGTLEPVPKHFLWGVATAGYQWEGGDTASNWYAWQRSGHVKEPVGLAADGWDHYKDDLARAKAMGLNAFRFSIEWSRIEPRPGQIDRSAVAHYHDMLETCRADGLTPIVTLLHYTYPAWLDRQAPRGRSAWECQSTVDAYVHYVDFVSREFGPEIRYYLTFNEPTVMIEGGYLAGCWPPGKKDLAAFLRASHNLIQAHSRAYDVIHANDPDAMVSFNNYAAAYQIGLNPSQAYLPAPGDDWFLKAFVSLLMPQADGPHGKHMKLDYMAVDYYKRLTIPTQIIPPSPSQWHVYPAGFAEVLERYYAVFHLPILVAENGLATDNDEPRADHWTRSAYMVAHIAELQSAIAHGVPIFGYTYWSLTDNYEWGSFNDRFGLFAVDCRDHDYRRIPRPAVNTYKQIVSQGGVTSQMLAQYTFPGVAEARADAH